jgi:hypothetical protein
MVWSTLYSSLNSTSTVFSIFRQKTSGVLYKLKLYTSVQGVCATVFFLSPFWRRGRAWPTCAPTRRAWLHASYRPSIAVGNEPAEYPPFVILCSRGTARTHHAGWMRYLFTPREECFFCSRVGRSGRAVTQTRHPRHLVINLTGSQDEGEGTESEKMPVHPRGARARNDRSDASAH